MHVWVDGCAVRPHACFAAAIHSTTMVGNLNAFRSVLGNGEIQWCFSQVKGTLDDDVTEGKFIV